MEPDFGEKIFEAVENQNLCWIFPKVFEIFVYFIIGNWDPGPRVASPGHNGGLCSYMDHYVYEYIRYTCRKASLYEWYFFPSLFPPLFLQARIFGRYKCAMRQRRTRAW